MVTRLSLVAFGPVLVIVPAGIDVLGTGVKYEFIGLVVFRTAVTESHGVEGQLTKLVALLVPWALALTSRWGSWLWSLLTAMVPTDVSDELASSRETLITLSVSSATSDMLDVDSLRAECKLSLFIGRCVWVPVLAGSSSVLALCIFSVENKIIVLLGFKRREQNFPGVGCWKS